MKIDKNIIKELTDYLNEFNLTEIEYTEKDTKIKVSKSNTSNSNQVVSVATSPSSPIKEICVEDGQPVEYGQTIIIVE